MAQLVEHEAESVACFSRAVYTVAGDKRLRLTRKEAIVLYLRIAEAMTNQEIANFLGHSVKTVEAHLTHIFDKIGDPEDTRRSRERVILFQYAMEVARMGYKCK